MTDPVDDLAAWQRVGQHVTSRRVELGYRTREALVDAGVGVKLRTLGDIETGRRARYHPSTIAVLETALRWKAGSVNAILDGKEPAEQGTATVLTHATGTGKSQAFVEAFRSVDAARSDDALIAVMHSDRLTDQQKARIIRTLIAEQERFARERADELIRDALTGGD